MGWVLDVTLEVCDGSFLPEDGVHCCQWSQDGLRFFSLELVMAEDSFSVPTVEGAGYSKPHLLDAISRGDIYYIATHGGYDLTKDQAPYTVPPNTYIFETQALGDLCMPTIDKPLWVLAQYREAFKGFLQNISDAPGSNGTVFRDALSYLTLYGPGDRLPIRMLSIAAEARAPRTMPMGIYKISPTMEPIPFPPGASGKSMASIENKLWEYGNETTNEAIIQSGADGINPRIFLFISCAAHDPTEANVARIARWNQIATLQRSAQLNAMMAGIHTLAGGAMRPGRNLASLTPEKIADPGYKPGFMRLSSPQVGRAMENVMHDITSTITCHGFAVYIIEGATVKPFGINGRFCLTIKEVIDAEKYLKTSEKTYYTMPILHNQTGAGRRRRTLRRRKRRLNKSKRNRGNARR